MAHIKLIDRRPWERLLAGVSLRAKLSCLAFVMVCCLDVLLVEAQTTRTGDDSRSTTRSPSKGKNITRGKTASLGKRIADGKATRSLKTRDLRESPRVARRDDEEIAPGRSSGLTTSAESGEDDSSIVHFDLKAPMTGPESSPPWTADGAAHPGPYDMPPGPKPGCNWNAEYWEHKHNLFVELLYWQPRGINTAFGEPRNGAVPIGAVGTTNPDHELGFKVGGAFALDSSSSLGAAYTSFSSDTSSTMSVTAPRHIESLVLHPGTAAAADDYLNSSADYGLDLQLVDGNYRGLLSGSPHHNLNYLFGLRYATLDQSLFVHQTLVGGGTNLSSDVDFSGLGVQFGLDGERRFGMSQFSVYGKWLTSLLPGTFKASYRQTDSASGATDAFLSWEDDRIVPVLEYEFGLAWMNRRGNFRISGGYYLAGWFNIVSQGAFIDAVQNSSYLNVDDTLTFDGLTVRAELKF